MSCFPCFSSHEKKSSKKVDGGRKEELPGASPRRDAAIPQQPRLENQKPKVAPVETTNKKDSRKEVADNNNAAQAFTFRELATATKNFRQECLIGEGGFGRVYKGRLEKIGRVVAVKQLDRNGLQGNREFLVEVLMLSALHHENLVNLIGYCADGEQRLLVYEYMPLGSVEEHLLDLAPGNKPLDWFTRMKIALQAAKGLEYLHAKVGPAGDKSVSSRVMGTYGYCAPEYQRTGQLTVKSDVYSFGVVLLELITGRRAIDNTRCTEEQNLVTWARPVFKDPHRFQELADPLLLGDFPVRALHQAVAVAAMCLQEEPSVRPVMIDVVSALSFLGTGGPDAAAASFDDPSPPSNQIMVGENGNLHDEESTSERQRAVAEAIEWGSTSRHNASRGESVSSL